MLSTLPSVRLHRASLPTCHQTAAQTGKALRGVISRGCQPHQLLLCLSSGNERRRHEQGLDVLSSLSEAPSELSVVHLGGIPLTPQSARALKTVLLAAAPLSVTSSVLASPSGAQHAPSLSSQLPPILPPLRLYLYGYDFTRPPAAAALELLAAAVVPRLTRLELWGCVGWPKRLGPCLQSCSRLRHLAVSFKPLVTASGPTFVGGGGGGATQPTLQSAAAAATAGAIAVYEPISAAATSYAVVHDLGLLRQLCSLELRGCAFNLHRASAGGGAAGRRPVSKAALARQAEEAAAPTPQQLACALYQLTGLTRLALEGLASTTPLLTSMSALKGLRSLELPDVAAGPQELASIAAAVPRLRTLTLGGVGQGAVLGLRDAGERAAVAAARPPEALALPPELAALNVVRNRPTLRTMRALRMAVEGRGGRVGVVVPGFEIDMPDVEFDPLLAFHRAEDGVMRSTLLPESAEAMAAAIRLLAEPPSPQPRSSMSLSFSSTLSSASAPVAKASRPVSPASLVSVGACAAAAAAEAEAPDAECCEEGEGSSLWQQELVIHNVQGSLEPPNAPATSLAPQTASAAEAETEATESPDSAGKDRPAAPRAGSDKGIVGPSGVEAEAWPMDRPVGHAVWILEMRRLRLRALELYGIGLQVADLAAVASLVTLQRLALVSGELAVEGLPALSSLSLLEYLELSRCTPRRRSARPSTAGRSSFVGGGGGDAAGTSPSGLGRGSEAVSVAGEGDDADCRTAAGTMGRSKRALLELCVTAPSLQRVLVVRGGGTGGVSAGPDGPLGAEWVRQQLRAMGPRQQQQPLQQLAGARCDKVGADSPGIWGVVGREGSRGWPEVSWD